MFFFFLMLKLMFLLNSKTNWARRSVLAHIKFKEKLGRIYVNYKQPEKRSLIIFALCPYFSQVLCQSLAKFAALDGSLDGSWAPISGVEDTTMTTSVMTKIICTHTRINTRVLLDLVIKLMKQQNNTTAYKNISGTYSNSWPLGPKTQCFITPSPDFHPPS